MDLIDRIFLFTKKTLSLSLFGQTDVDHAPLKVQLAANSLCRDLAWRFLAASCSPMLADPSDWTMGGGYSFVFAAL